MNLLLNQPLVHEFLWPYEPWAIPLECWNDGFSMSHESLFKSWFLWKKFVLRWSNLRRYFQFGPIVKQMYEISYTAGINVWCGSFLTRNQGNHQNFDPSLLTNKLWLVFMGMKQKKSPILKIFQFYESVLGLVGLIDVKDKSKFIG